MSRKTTSKTRSGNNGKGKKPRLKTCEQNYTLATDNRVDLKGLKVVIQNPDEQPKIAINSFRYSVQETVIRNGDPNCPPFERHSGISSDALMNKFGFTYYFANAKLRNNADLDLNSCIPACLKGKVKIIRTRRNVSKNEFSNLVDTIRIHNVA
ncbi:hypothetical protein [Vibrio parahaemolyticus]|uniref:hypothetical protein n=1 Tax=Vibrio parahaemolyticus TaxID=670 RepID=UPI00226A70E7|nr:hypothetical protein [Vibrio parahaemolyticus]MCX8904283.1 hypothetical protein [Vibrio parahaemolyticus]